VQLGESLFDERNPGLILLRRARKVEYLTPTTGLPIVKVFVAMINELLSAVKVFPLGNLDEE
jgi:hypothetical protein